MSAEDAVSTAEEAAGQGTLHAVELDYDEDAGAWQWDVKILVDRTDHKVVIDAVSGEVVTDEQERTDDQEQPVDLEDPMSYDEASGIATEEVDGPIRSWKLEYDDGRTQYSSTSAPATTPRRSRSTPRPARPPSTDADPARHRRRCGARPDRGTWVHQVCALRA